MEAIEALRRAFALCDQGEDGTQIDGSGEPAYNARIRSSEVQRCKA